jgi:hypothetical protein
LWHFSDVPGRPDDVRSRGKTGSGLPTAKMTRLTPNGHSLNLDQSRRAAFHKLLAVSRC